MTARVVDVQIEHPAPASVRVRLAGEIDLATAPVVGSRLERVLAQPVKAIAVDLGEVRFCDAAGYRELIRFREEARRRGIGVSVDNPRTSVARVMQLLGVDQLFAP